MSSLTVRVVVDEDEFISTKQTPALAGESIKINQSHYWAIAPDVKEKKNDYNKNNNKTTTDTRQTRLRTAVGIGLNIRQRRDRDDK